MHIDRLAVGRQRSPHLRLTHSSLRHGKGGVGLGPRHPSSRSWPTWAASALKGATAGECTDQHREVRFNRRR